MLGNSSTKLASWLVSEIIKLTETKKTQEAIQ
jgi:hypothetical protein